MKFETIRSTVMRGFTLVELLIVVIILAILAAIVVPQFASSTDDAKLAALDSNLANMRAAIELYYTQHGDYPSAVASSGGVCPGGGTAGTGAVNTTQAFQDQLFMYTNATGQSCTTKDANFKYGPYMKKAAIPNNPITSNNTVAIVTAGALNMVGDGAAAGGWKFDNQTGQFIANDTNLAPDSGLGFDRR